MKYTDIKSKDYPYIKAKDVRLHLQPDRSLLSWKRKNLLSDEGIIINNIAADIIKEIDGTSTINDIVNKFSNRYNDNPNKVRDIIINFIIELKKLYNVPIELSSKSNFSPIIISGSSEYVLPMHVALELTYRCNLMCKHCYVNSDIKRTETMPLNMAKKVLKELNKIGVVSIELTGGEPTIHPNFMEILDYAYSLNFSLIAILTNGTLIDKSFINHIKPYRNKIAFQIDLHGDNKEYVVWFTGVDFAFEREIKAIKNLVSENFIVRVTTSVTPKNLEQMHNIAKLTKELGVHNIVFSPIVPTGRAINDKENIILSYNRKAYNLFMNNIQELTKKYGKSFISVFEDKILKRDTNCGAGTRSTAITPKGYIKICQMSTPLTSLGSVFEIGIEEIFRRHKDITSLLLKLPAPSAKHCGNCNNLWYCYNCIARGLSKFKESKGECVWGQKYIAGTPLEKLLQIP